MPTIRDLAASQRLVDDQGNRIEGTAWRDRLLPAHFDGRMFHVESGSRESGRRVVVHEFPKKELDYAEDLGKRAISFTVRGYCIVYPHDDPTALPLYRRDYQIARDQLIARLETGGSGVLQLPTLEPIKVKCQRYRVTEDEKAGGYCVFDMQFVEAGVQPFMPDIDSGVNLRMQADQLKQQVASVWAAQRAKTPFDDTRLKFLIGPPPGIGALRR